MATLSVRLTDFCATSSADALPRRLHLRVKATTGRAPQDASPPVSSDGRFEGWAPEWTEHLPDRLALRAAAVIIEARVGPDTSRRRWGRRGSLGVLGSARLNCFSMATGTVRWSLRLHDSSGNPMPITLSFDTVVENRTSVELNFGNVCVALSPLPLVPYLVLSFGDSGKPCVISTVRHVASVEPVWTALPTLLVPDISLRNLAHGSARIRVHDAANSNHLVAEFSLAMHDVWAAMAYPGHAASFSGQLQVVGDGVVAGTISGSLRAVNTPTTAQMVGGITTDTGMTGGKPVIFGVDLPQSSRVSGVVGGTSSLPAGWVQLVDTFGYRYYHCTLSGTNVWTEPSRGDNLQQIMHREEKATSDAGYERIRHGIFRRRNDGTETWIHPAATILSMSWGESFGMRSGASSASAATALGVDQMDETGSDSSVSSLPIEEALRVRDPPAHPCPILPKQTRAGILAPEQISRANSFITDVQWTRLNSSAPGPGTEGHTLTSVLGGEKLLKFGGAYGSRGGKTNELYALDVPSMNWRVLQTSGVPPLARTGHGAVALGTDKSRLLVFGGTCRQGRLNDLHMLDAENLVWSPVSSCTGAAPPARARLGMTATSDGTAALLFGGRSIYRYLGGAYFDPLFVHAFHAEREEWLKLVPRGSGPRPAPRSGCAVEFVNDRHMFVHGGYDDGDCFFNDTYLFDLASSSWQALPYPNEPTRPSARESHASTVLGNSVLVYGGDSERCGYLSDLHTFDATRMRWTGSPATSGHGPGGLCGAAMAAIDEERVVLVGGDNGFAMSRDTQMLEVVHRSTHNEDSLCELARMRGPDAETCVVCLDGLPTATFIFCGHTVCCSTCARRVRDTCPICRMPFAKVVYNVMSEW